MKGDSELTQLRLDAASASNEELAAALKDSRYDHHYYGIVAEIERRREEKNAPPAIAREHRDEAARPFDPRTDVSADAKYLWIRIFIWFWAVPAAAG